MVRADAYDLVSAGRDGVVGTVDDITNVGCRVDDGDSGAPGGSQQRAGTRKHYALWSAGPDGVSGTGDDVTDSK